MLLKHPWSRVPMLERSYPSCTLTFFLFALVSKPPFFCEVWFAVADLLRKGEEPAASEKINEKRVMI